MSNFILIFVFFLLYEVKNFSCDEFAIKLGDEIDLCCSLQYDKKNTLVFWKDQIRLGTLFDKKLNKGDWDLFAKEFEGFKLEMRKETICITKEQASIKEKGLVFKCSTVEGFFGVTLTTQTLTIKLYEELKFVVLPLLVNKVALGSSTSIQCESTGSPGLKTIWRKENSEVIATGISSVELTIPNVTLSMSNNKYICEASIDVPPGVLNSTIQRSISLDVQFPPQIIVNTSAFHTDLVIKEIIKITVKGNPRPNLSCRSLAIEADRVVSIGEPSPATYQYQIEFDNITLNHIGTYECEASNELGIVKQKISLILGPLNLRITSSNETSYANYYLLQWEVDSKSKVHLSKIFIDQYNGTMASSVTQRVMADKELSPVTVQEGNADNNWRFSFSQPVTNLSSDTLYRITLQMCSKYQCIDAKYPVVVKTQIFNGNNNMSPGEMNVAQNSVQNDPGKGVGNVMPIKSLCLVEISLMLLYIILF